MTECILQCVNHVENHETGMDTISLHGAETFKHISVYVSFHEAEMFKQDVFSSLKPFPGVFPSMSSAVMKFAAYKK